MNISSIKGVRIEGIGACVPKKEIDNSVFAKEYFDEDLSNTIRAIGVEKRRVCADKDTTSLDLSLEAARELFNQIDFDVNDIGGIVFVTLTPDYLMPNNASRAQSLLNLPKNVAAFDVNHACSGYVYGLWVSALMAKNLNKKILLLDGDTNSKYVSPYDKATALLFGDAGTATIISPVDDDSEWKFTFFTDSVQGDALMIPGIGFRNMLSKESLEYQIFPDGGKRRLIDMKMNGEDVFNYVVLTVPKILKNFMREANVTPDDLQYLLLHQANAFMLRKLARKIKFPLEKMPVSIAKYGNTSSVSIPLNICSEISDHIKENKAKVLMTGMGAGLSTGAAILDIGVCHSIGVLEKDM